MRIILKWIFNFFRWAQNSVRWRGFVKTIMQLILSKMSQIFWPKSIIIKFSEMNLTSGLFRIYSHRVETVKKILLYFRLELCAR